MKDMKEMENILDRSHETYQLNYMIKFLEESTDEEFKNHKEEINNGYWFVPIKRLIPAPDTTDIKFVRTEEAFIKRAKIALNCVILKKRIKKLKKI